MVLIQHALTERDGPFRVAVQHATGRVDPPADQPADPPACAAIFGTPGDGCLVRVHSRCLYSEAFGSQDCDCRAQLSRSLDLIRASGAGVVVYLDQEGRGSGLLAKALGYQYAQATGADTFASYRALGLPLDRRSYAAAADLLKQLGLTEITLLTNNPEKVRGLCEAGLVVTRRPLLVPVDGEAAGYLAAKRAHGHLLPPTPAGRPGPMAVARLVRLAAAALMAAAPRRRFGSFRRRNR